MKSLLLLAALLLAAVPATAENSVTVGNTIVSSDNVGPTIAPLGTAIDGKKNVRLHVVQGLRSSSAGNG
jgi:hypothetical protein